MYSKISDYIISKMNKLEILDKELSIYQFGLMILISYACSAAIVIMIGILHERLISSMIFLYLFDKLRVFSGGYHANSYIKCNTLFISLFILYDYISGLISYSYSFFLCCALLLVTINIIPTYHPNKVVTKDLINRAKIIAIKRFFLTMLISMILSFIDINISTKINVIIIGVLILIWIQFNINERRRCTGAQYSENDS